MDNVTRGEVVAVLSNDGFEVFEMVERKGFRIPSPPFVVARAATATLPRQPDESELALYVMRSA